MGDSRFPDSQILCSQIPKQPLALLPPEPPPDDLSDANLNLTSVSTHQGIKYWWRMKLLIFFDPKTPENVPSKHMACQSNWDQILKKFFPNVSTS